MNHYMITARERKAATIASYLVSLIGGMGSPEEADRAVAALPDMGTTFRNSVARSALQAAPSDATWARVTEIVTRHFETARKIELAIAKEAA